MTMVRNYRQIQKQIEALKQQAQALRQQELDGVIARIRVAIEHYGITAGQLGFGKGVGPARRKARAGGTGGGARYQDGQGNSWTGRGPRPRWLREAIDAGRSLTEFASTGASIASGSASSNGAKKHKSQVRFRDDAGHTWTGIGPRPRWLKEALAGGRALEELKV